MSKAIAGRLFLSALMLTAHPNSAQTGEHEHHVPGAQAIALSAELAALLSEEMLAIEEGLGSLMTAMAAGDWPHVAKTSEMIDKSYILTQQLTPEQREELKRVLPPGFKSLDSAFHQAANKLAKAANERDAELAVFHSYKLMEACVACHATYAGERFPGFAGGEESTKHH